MRWGFKKQAGQVAVSAKGFSLGTEVGESNVAISPEVAANQDVAAATTPVAPEPTPTPVSHVVSPDRFVSSEREVSASKVAPGSYVVPVGYRISGVVISHRPLVIRGELHGRAVSAGEVLVEKTGILRAPAEVETLRVHGRVLSPVRATSRVEILSGGDVQGDLETPGLSVAPGGRVSGGLLRVGAE
jgi:cytoskeletal protein CcmA (bactofilin family)